MSGYLQLRVGDILIRGLKWDKLLDPNKKGQWWLSGDMAVKTENVELVASTIDREVLEAQKMLQLAAAQRMNTDARRAIFCIIMSGDDYIDAFEKLLRLDLPAKQVGKSYIYLFFPLHSYQLIYLTHNVYISCFYRTERLYGSLWSVVYKRECLTNITLY